MDHLSSLDASFLHLETPETPMHVASLLLLELPDNYQGNFYEEVKKLLAARIHLARVLHRKLAAMPFELGDPVWIEDNDADIDTMFATFGCRSPAPWSRSAITIRSITAASTARRAPSSPTSSTT